MQIIKKIDISIPDLVHALKSGKTLVYPTETCYGLGCDATNQEAVEKIFTIKHREKNKSLIILCPDVAMAKQYISWSPIIDQIAQKYWPGPLTVVGNAKPLTPLAPGIVRPDGTVAFRVSSHPYAQEIVKQLSVPLVSTSANIAGQPNSYSLEDLHEMLGFQSIQPDIVIDAGTLTHSKPSTVVKITDGKVEVLRQGEVFVSL